MKTQIIALLGLLLLSGAMAQAPASTEECDPFSAGTALVDLAEDIGVLACKVPSSVNITAVMSQLTGTAAALSLDDLKALPEYLSIMLSVNPQTLAPFLALSASQLRTLLPLLKDVPVSTLKAIFPLISRSGPGTVEKMVQFLKAIPRAQLQRLLPLLGSLTQGQINVLQKALEILPSGGFDSLAQMIRALGPVTDSFVAVKQSFGFFRNGNTVPRPAPTPSPAFNPFFGLFGRRLAQESAGGSSTGAAAACDPGMAGIEVGVALVNDFGKVVCQFGADNLRPILKELLTLLNKQSPETLAQLPELTAALTKADPQLFSVFFEIPAGTLKELIPILSSLDGSSIQGLLQTLGSQDAATIDNMVFFLQQVPVSTIEKLLPLFSSLSSTQTQTIISFMNALSPGQITLSIHLLSTFGFALDAIGNAIPPAQQRGTTFNIGPIKVTIGGAAPGSAMGVSSAGVPFIRHTPFLFGVPFFG